MGANLIEWVKNCEPKIDQLSETERSIYRYGLMVLASFTNDEFIDVPLLPDNRFEADGLYYTIPYFHDEMLWTNGKCRTLLVLWQVENNSSYCPLRIDLELEENSDCKLIIYDQRGDWTTKKLFVQREGTSYYTELTAHDTVTLSQLLN